MENDEIVVLPSGTEISVEAARGDLGRTIDFLANDADEQGLAADMEHVSELLTLLAARIPDTKEDA